MPNGAQFQNLAAGYKGTWVDQLLEAIGAPTTDSNRAALRLWAASEGTAQSNNFLAISGQAPGATTCLAQCGTSSPVYAYGSSAAGVSATANFLQGSNYAGVVSAFQSDAGLASIWNAINRSPWCAGCQGGFYPVQLAEVVRPGGRAPASSTAGALQTASPLSTAGEDAGSRMTVFGKPADKCAVGEPGILGVGKFCLLSYGQLQAILGGMLVVAGAGVMLVGLGVVVAFGLPKSNPLQKVAPTKVAARAVGASRSRSRARSTEAERQRRREESVTDAESRAAAARYGRTRARSEPGPSDRSRAGDRAQADRFAPRAGEEPFAA